MSQHDPIDFTKEARSLLQIDNLELDHSVKFQVPPKDPYFVPWGHFKEIEKIMVSDRFFPFWISGLSGLAKTLFIEQACAFNNKICVMVNITIESDEDSLLGGLRLKDGNTVPFLGPVAQAMLLGAKCVLDEIDLGDGKLMCLQNVLMGKPVFIKRLGRIIKPAPGFNICATSNTKGKGAEVGRFMYTNIMNEAMIDRFRITYEQDYPTRKIERQIYDRFFAVNNHNVDEEDEQFLDDLSMWVENIRASYKDGAVEEVVTTRRAVGILDTYLMFGGKPADAVRRGIQRFDPVTRQAFLKAFTAIQKHVPVVSGNTRTPF